ncbi:glycosyltransferase family 2 protein [Fulvivirga sp. M361]|uniref:glycosyltransferase family 2 protein n=1 Tax=Fulvivirga sp. M361 TaxID=2594266 RepID=UPI0011799B3B|nr:glycosyltransferase family A protein [Fulvivirga sp. M361]TRX60115.1 glycosyltransferase family 2 protein [Fulvivirga sp. M361]
MIRNPNWLRKYVGLDVENDASIWDKVNGQLDRNTADVNPDVSIVIPAWNEEEHIVNCIYSLAEQETQYAYEIIVVDNNSQDRTWEYLQKMKIKQLKQPIQGPGPSRQLGQENAQGKYILLADADCIYPKKWIELLINKLKRKDTVAVYGKHAFIGDKRVPRWQFFFYDVSKSLFMELRHLNRPYLNSYGMSIGYIKELGLKIGFVMDKSSGSDGFMVRDLMPYGKVRRVRTPKATVWTGYRALLRHDSLWDAIKRRVRRELIIIRDYFFPSNIK